MESRSFYNTILTEHNLHPLHKQVLKDANLALEGVNPSCGDDIVLQLKVEDGKITDGAFAGSGCAVSQASADMMIDLIIGKTKEEAFYESTFQKHPQGHRPDTGGGAGHCRLL